MKEFSQQLQANFDSLMQTGMLFVSQLTGAMVWDIYLKSFPEEMDPVFRDPASTVHNCNHCNNFIRRYGNIVAIKDYKIITIFDDIVNEEYGEVAKVISKALKEAVVSEVFFETYAELNGLPYEKCNKTQKKFQLGVDRNFKRYTKEEAEKYGVVKENETVDFHHMHLFLNKAFVDQTGKSIESIQSKFRDNKSVFLRGMAEIPLDTLLLVRDLIAQGSLLNGEAHMFKLDAIIPHKKAYDTLSAKERDNWAWITSYNLNIAKFRNELIGVLCTELAEGKELNAACLSWNKRVDPANYMKAVAPITKAQISLAQKFVEENGYVESFDRRFATIDDIKVSEIKHINSGDGKLKTVSMFDNIKTTSTRHKRSEFDKVEEVGIDKFMKDILPSCDSVEVYLENQFANNMVTLTTANRSDSKPIFKWDSNYSWTYNGNLAGKSEIKETVKNKGGAVDGVLRFSIMWAKKDGDNSDLDAHCIESAGGHIYYNNRHSGYTNGNLDIDITKPNSQMPNGAVENISYADIKGMKNGIYSFSVNQFSARSSKGFKAEIEVNGELYQYEYTKPVTSGQNVNVATVTLNNGEFRIDHKLPSNNTSKDVYALNTNEFHRVNLMCLSPNHWDTNKVGNKHFFFMLDKAKSPLSLRSFHNENLNDDLLPHRKVMDVLGVTNMLKSTDKQLSGVGFNATVRNEMIVRLKGNFKRVLKIKF